MSEETENTEISESESDAERTPEEALGDNIFTIIKLQQDLMI